jgi:hypothetical protein
MPNIMIVDKYTGEVIAINTSSIDSHSSTDVFNKVYQNFNPHLDWAEQQLRKCGRL